MGGGGSRRRRAGQPRSRPAARQPGADATAREGDPRPRRRSPRPHLQSGARRPPAHTARSPPRCGRDGARAERPMIDAVLLIAFGGPTTPQEIRPFLDIVTHGRRIPPERLEEVAHHYEQMPGGRSPLNELTEAQAEGLRRALRAGGTPLPVFVGMRNWHPFLHETMASMVASGCRRALGIILSSFRSEASWERYQADVAAARARTPNAPEIVFAAPWFEHPSFVAAVAAGIEPLLNSLPAGERAQTPIVFTAHSVPVAMAEASPYVADFTATSRAV